MVYRAVCIGRPSPLSAAVVKGWLDAGHELSGFWSSRPPSRGDYCRGLVRREVSLLAGLRRAGIVARLCPKRSDQLLIAEALHRDRPDVLIVAGFPQRIGSAILDAMPGRCVNLHPALLPKYRGPTPGEALFIDRAIDRHGGVTLHLIDAEFDTGPIIAATPAPAGAGRNPLAYRLAAARIAAGLVRESLPRYLAGEIAPVVQDDEAASYRSVTDAERVVSAPMTTERIALLAGGLPWVGRVWAEGPDGRIRIAGFIAAAPRTGEAMRVTARTVSFDCVDGRVTLRRYDVLAGLGLKLRRERLILAA